MSQRVLGADLLKGWIQLGTAAVLTCLASLIVGFLVRRTVTDAFWVVRPVLYFTRVEHMVGQEHQALFWVAAVVAIGVLVVLYRIHPSAAATLSVVGGLMVGGTAANHVEAAVLGGVTDFIGIRTVGIYSAGDMAIDVGMALIPVAAVIWLHEYPVTLRLVAGMTISAAEILVALVTAHPAPLVGYLVVPVSGLVGLAALVKAKAGAVSRDAVARS